MTRPVTDLLFRPRSVVVYGASSDPEKLSGRPLAYLRKFGYGGALYAVNPHRETVQGVPAYDDISALPEPADLAVIVVPAASVMQALDRCANAGVGVAIVFASGFAEVGAEGAAVQELMRDIVRRTGMRIVGPNCLGVFAVEHRAFATFSTAFDDVSQRPDSPIALVTQSGAVGTFTFTTMNALGLGVRYFANTGNETDVTVTELLTSLAAAPDVDLLLGHLEAGTDLDGLDRLAAAAEEWAKPLVLLKGGRSRAGARAVAAHTGSIAGADAPFDRILAAHGAIRVPSMEALADTALAFASARTVQRRRLTVITQSGGAGALATDAAVELGLIVESWNAEDRAKVAAALPYFGSASNPIDVTGALINDVSILDRTLEIACVTPDTDAVLVVLGNCDSVAGDVVQTLTRAHAATAKPFVVAWSGGSGRPREALLANHVPTYGDPWRAVHALSRLVEHSLRARDASSGQTSELVAARRRPSAESAASFSSGAAR